jgi:alpha-1,2-mannosyltransferase
MVAALTTYALSSGKLPVVARADSSAWTRSATFGARPDHDPFRNGHAMSFRPGSLIYAALIIINVGAFILGFSIIIHGIVIGYNVPIGDFGQPMGLDFYCFWSAGRLTLDGHVRDIFSPDALAAFQQAYLKSSQINLPWFYPPLLLLYVSCAFAMLPYKLAYFAYLVISFCSYYFSARHLFPKIKPIFILGFPGFWFNLISGQNGLLTALILTYGLIYLAKNQITAGVILALLSYKPQLCFALPVFLLVERRYQTIAAGILTFVASVGLSTLLFGLDIWALFYNGLREAQNFNQLSGHIRPESLAHLYGTLKASGLSHTLAMQINYVFAAIAGCAALRIWFLSNEADVKNAVLILMTLLLPPHLLYYDFVVTGALIAWLWPKEHLRPALAIIWIASTLWIFLPSPGIPMLTIAASMLLIQLNRDCTPAVAPGRQAT